jgi:hypothetical protein
MGTGYERLIRELVMVQTSGHRHVGLLLNVHAEFQALEKRWKKKLEQHFQNYGIRDARLPKEHFNSEGRFPTGGQRSRDIQLVAFKAFQHRLYGTTVGIRGTETFIGLRLVTDKKTDRADQALLKRIAESFRDYDE